MLDEFCATTFDRPSLEEDIGIWVLDYNYHRVHGSLDKASMQRWSELNEQTSMWDEIAEAFDPGTDISYVDWITLRRGKARANT